MKGEDKKRRGKALLWFKATFGRDKALKARKQSSSTAIICLLEGRWRFLGAKKHRAKLCHISFGRDKALYTSPQTL